MIHIFLLEEGKIKKTLHFFWWGRSATVRPKGGARESVLQETILSSEHENLHGSFVLKKIHRIHHKEHFFGPVQYRLKNLPHM